MVKEPKPSFRASGLFKSKLFRFAVLLSVIFSSLPTYTLALASPPTPLSLNSEEAQFIIGPQAALSSSWFDTTEIQRARTHGELCPTTPPTDAAGVDNFVLLNYYDLPLTEYIAYARTGDGAFLSYAQKCADAWWRHPDWIKQGAQRDFSNGYGPPPRHAGIGGLILRALDGRP